MTSPQPGAASLRRRILESPVGLLLVALVAMWAIEIVDTVVLDDRLQRNGIHPRELGGVDGVVWAPFLHSNFGHIASNTVPLLVLGALVATRGLRYWAWVTVVAVSVGGGLTWLLGGSGNHIGASGVAFAYMGAILGAALFERQPRALGAALIAIFFYSGMLVGLVPRDSISWEGHLFGLLAGLFAARFLAEPRRRVGEDRPEDVQPWEIDEPWLE